ncbi:zinc finger BED domain-containing protein 4-like [Eupeodes corollae]|uniref:zinc finger BED domain-containing protein 4-like n=1 Tax=Eupeodes corollae TaxID=290404 RepID=UPI002493CA5C|nr:zinc finger BED domain-containing protein 4-like [Eupeodes corollae]
MAMRRRKTSILWDHFSETEKEKAKCNYCKEVICFSSGSLGNLSRHLNRKHAGISIRPLERQPVITPSASATPETASASPNPGVINVDNENGVSHRARQSQTQLQSRSVQQKMDSFTERPLSQQKQSKIDQQLITMIAKEYHPLRLVEEPQFGKFVSLLCPAYRLPTRKTLSQNLLPQLFLKLEQEVKTKIENAPAICLTTDAWTSINNQSFIAVTAHYIDSESAQLCSNLLGCTEYNQSHSSDNMCAFLKDQISKWKIDQKVGAIVSDNAKNILSAVQKGNWRSIGCFAHLLNLVVQAALQNIEDTLKKVKSVVEFFKRSTQALYKLKEIQSQMDLPTLKLKQDVPTRWNSTYDMLDRILKIKNAVIATLAIVRNELSLNNEDWDILERILPILKIFLDITVEISSEKNVSLSKVIVYCRLLKFEISRFTEQLSDPQIPECVRKFVKKIQEEVQSRFNNLEKNFLYAEATIFDPRFKNKGFRDNMNFKSAFDKLKQKVASQQQRSFQIQTASSTSPVEEVVAVASISSSTSANASIWDAFDKEISSLVPENTVAAGIIELEKYLNEPPLKRTENPLIWWNARKCVYPILYRYMLKRLNLVATSVPCERTFSKAGMILTDKRSRLSASKASQLLFISSNM